MQAVSPSSRSRAGRSRATLSGDSPRRPLYVYLPPGYDDDPERRYPCVYVLQGFFGALPAWLHRSNNLRPTYPEMADELFSAGSAPPCILVFVDAWTSLGGSQFVDSPGTGRYHSYLCEDVVSFVDANFRTLDGPLPPRGAGQVLGRLRGDDNRHGCDQTSSAASRPTPGDALYEYCHLPMFVVRVPDAARAITTRASRPSSPTWPSARPCLGAATPKSSRPGRWRPASPPRRTGR